MVLELNKYFNQCWACLIKHNNHDDKHIYSTEYYEIFEECFKITPPPVQGTLCIHCTDKLLAAFQFLQLCKRSNITIRKYLQQGIDLPETTETTRRLIKTESSEIDDEPVDKCPLCPRVFQSSSALSKHCKRKHKALKVTKIPIEHRDSQDYDRFSDTRDDSPDEDLEIKPFSIDGTELPVTIKEEPLEVSFDNEFLAAIKSDDEEKPLITLKKEVVKTKRSVGRPKKKEPDETSDGTFSCDTCPRRFASEIGLKLHANKHVPKLRVPKICGPKLYTCSVCNETFEKSSLLSNHRLLKHSTDKIQLSEFQCGKCDMRFMTPDDMSQHDCDSAISDRDICCAFCHCKFSYKSQLDQHVLRRHSDKEKNPKVAFCSICNKGFTTLKYLETHARMHNGDTTYTCDICTKSFNSKWHLKEHTKWHSAEKPFLCSECGQRFIRNDYLIIHMRRHKGEKPFKCKFCGKGFPRTTDLRVHERYHTGEKTHLCTICGKGFQRQYNLTVHLRVHTGEKPYVCSYCGKRFAQGNDLKSHVRRHTGERYNCEICAEGFIQGYHLTQHKRSVHGIEATSHIRRVVKHATPESQKGKNKEIPSSNLNENGTSDKVADENDIDMIPENQTHLNAQQGPLEEIKSKIK